jgi:hypothetical protein
MVHSKMAKNRWLLFNKQFEGPGDGDHTSTSEKYDRLNGNAQTQLIMIMRQNCLLIVYSTLGKPIGVHGCFIHPYLAMLICNTGGLSLCHPLDVLACKKTRILRINLFLHHILLTKSPHPCSPSISN